MGSNPVAGTIIWREDES